MKRIHAIDLAVAALAAFPLVVSCGGGGPNNNPTLRFTPDHHLSVAVGGAFDITADLDNAPAGIIHEEWLWESADRGKATVTDDGIEMVMTDKATVNGIAPGEVGITVRVDYDYLDPQGGLPLPGRASKMILVTVIP